MGGGSTTDPKTNGESNSQRPSTLAALLRYGLAWPFLAILLAFLLAEFLDLWLWTMEANLFGSICIVTMLAGAFGGLFLWHRKWNPKGAIAGFLWLAPMLIPFILLGVGFAVVVANSISGDLISP